MKKIYQFYKAIEFRTLWVGNNPLTSFRRVASESATGTKTLVGVVELTKALTKVNQLKDKAVDCFSRHIFTTNVQKWSFDEVKNKGVCFCLLSFSVSSFLHAVAVSLVKAPHPFLNNCEKSSTKAPLPRLHKEITNERCSFTMLYQGLL